MDKTQHMRELVDLLNRASKAYYADDAEIMSNYEYDRLYDELSALEEETGVILSDSPTQSVGYEAVDHLPKERHESPMLSLQKTKSRDELRSWLEDREGLLSWKLDGLTVVLTYEDGGLKKAVTRGNGEIGEVITANARTFVNLPSSIPYKGKLVLRGEAVIPYSVFEKINASIPEADAKYKNPRNLCSGSVRQLSSRITAERKVHFYAFSFVSGQRDGFDGFKDREERFVFLREQGFEVVEYRRVDKETLSGAIEYFEKAIEDFDIPSDGLVLTLCDLDYAASLGRTAKFPRDSIAFKWADETSDTVLRDIEWSPSRTGLINPVAIFDPVELEGTTVTRASVHNVSILRELALGIGDKIRVYKANMIIPQIAENLTRSGNARIPESCPVCRKATRIVSSSVKDAGGNITDNDSASLVLQCTNPECPAKSIMGFVQFAGRDAMNIEGLSEKTIEKLIELHLLGHREYADIYHIADHKDTVMRIEGFGDKSFDNLVAGIDASRDTTMQRLVYALGIPGIGAANAKMLSRHFKYDIEALKKADKEELSEIDKMGPVLASAVYDYFRDEKNLRRLDRILAEVNIVKPESDPDEEAAMMLSGKTFVITGSVEHFANRTELKDLIEEKGGKVTGSVSAKTDYLINNDVSSMSGKNKKAKELSIPIISEEDFLKMLDQH